MKTDWKSVSDAFCARQRARRIAFTLKPRKTPTRTEFRRGNDTPLFITSTIRGVFFADIAWKLARPMPLLTATDLSLLRSRTRTEFRRGNDTPLFITSTIRGVFFADIAWKLARPMPLLTATDLSLLRTI